jgi:colanic acid/amylovoran biosynthesis protein
MVSTGGGFVNDNFPFQAVTIMQSLLGACELGVPVAMFGQGLGPATHAEIVQSATELFPKLAVLGLREGRQAVKLASDWLGHSTSNLHVTGDDAIEPVYKSRATNIGACIGMNLRMSAYSGVDEGIAAIARSAVQAVAADLKAPTIPVIISRHPGDSDVTSLRSLIGSHPILENEACYDSPEAVASAAGQCRVVITGSYHAGVFALAQGIPIIGLSRSAYYDDKFLGLRDQFGGGVELVHFDDPDFGRRLVDTARMLWNVAPDLRSKLLTAAEAQIGLSRGVYEKFASIVRSRHKA